MWVFEEIVDGRKLTEIINTEHENVKYLKGISLPTNVEAVADIAEACKDANILIFVLPHQFLAGLCDKIKPVVAPDCIGVSLIKGVHFDDSGMVLISEIISKEMGGMDVSVLMGANLANEVAAGDFSESTIGYNNEAYGKLLQSVFNDPRFQVSIVNDVPGVEVCGAVKNVVALGAGFIDGMGGGDNSKAAIIRIGLMEMKKFIQTHYPKVQDSTFFESCGVADLIVTCYGGRNRKCAEVCAHASDNPSAPCFGPLRAQPCCSAPLTCLHESDPDMTPLCVNTGFRESSWHQDFRASRGGAPERPEDPGHGHGARGDDDFAKERLRK